MSDVYLACKSSFLETQYYWRCDEMKKVRSRDSVILVREILLGEKLDYNLLHNFIAMGDYILEH